MNMSTLFAEHERSFERSDKDLEKNFHYYEEKNQIFPFLAQWSKFRSQIQDCQTQNFMKYTMPKFIFSNNLR